MRVRTMNRSNEQSNGFFTVDATTIFDDDDDNDDADDGVDSDDDDDDKERIKQCRKSFSCIEEI